MNLALKKSNMLPFVDPINNRQWGVRKRLRAVRRRGTTARSEEQLVIVLFGGTKNSNYGEREKQGKEEQEEKQGGKGGGREKDHPSSLEKPPEVEEKPFKWRKYLISFHLITCDHRNMQYNTYTA